MSESRPYPSAMFEGLVFDEAGHAARTALVGGSAQYVVDDGGFERYVDAERIDREVLRFVKEQVLANRDEVTQGMLSLMGKDDLFTKAMIDSSINRMDDMPVQRLPEEARAWLGMLGFRIVVNVHGEIVNLEMPAAPDTEGE